MRRFHDESRPDPRSILVVLPTWVGDVVMGTPALEAIRNRFPRAAITYLIRPNVRDVIAGAPWMNEVFAWPAGKTARSLLTTLRLGLSLRSHRFDWGILLTNSFRSALVTFLGGVSRRFGYERDRRGWLLTDPLPVPRVNGRVVPSPMVDYYGTLAWAVGCDRPGDRLTLFTCPDDDRAVHERLERLGLAGHHPLVLITPGASFGPAKLWPADRYAQVCDRLVERFDARVILTYGPGERQVAAQVQRSMRHPAVIFDDPPLTLGQLKSLVRRGDLLLCNDTGPRHFGKAFGLAVVTVFGPTAPEWTDTSYDLERKVRIDVDCGPCQQKTCPLGHLKCMTGVTVDAVYHAAAELLAQRLARLATAPP